MLGGTIMARYKKEVRLSEISEKGKNKVRKRFGDIVVFEMDNDREKAVLQKFHEIEKMELDQKAKDLLLIHSSIIIFTNIRIDVEDEEFAQIVQDMPLDLKGAILEIQMMIAHSITSVTQQIEHARVMAQFKEMVSSKPSDSVE